MCGHMVSSAWKFSSAENRRIPVGPTVASLCRCGFLAAYLHLGWAGAAAFGTNAQRFSHVVVLRSVLAVRTLTRHTGTGRGGKSHASTPTILPADRVQQRHSCVLELRHVAAPALQRFSEVCHLQMGARLFKKCHFIVCIFKHFYLINVRLSKGKNPNVPLCKGRHARER